MDHHNKAWLWRKKSSEKTILATTNKVDSHLRKTKDVQRNQIGNGVVPDSKSLNAKLASGLIDCPAKENPATKKIGNEETVMDVTLTTAKPKQELNGALAPKELSVVEEEEKTRDGVIMAMSESEEALKKLEEKYADVTKKLKDVSAENADMAKVILVKERLAEDLRASKSRAEAEFNVLMARLDSTEKENSFLKYEFNVIDRELRIRNEEMEYFRRSADGLQKQHVESKQRIADLEQECLRLRAAARKRVNGPTGNNNMRSEAQVRGRNQTETRRRKSNSLRDAESCTETRPSNDVTFMFERLRIVEEENEALKKVLSGKIGADSQLARRNPVNYDVGSDDAISSSGSWANSSRAAEISLMDDFVEMEKWAIVSAADKPLERRQGAAANIKPFDWLQIVLSAMMDQKQVSKRSLGELLEDIRIALGFVNSPPAKCRTPKEADLPPPISGYLTWKSPKGSPIMNSFPKEENCDQDVRSGLSESVSKIVKLIRGISPVSSSPGDYFIRVFQWRNSELNDVLQMFVRTCEDLSSGRCDMERFTEEVASILDWVLNNHVTPKEAANTREKIKRHFGWNEAEQERDNVVRSQDSLVNPLEEQNSRLKDELKSVRSEKAEIEARLNLATERSEGLAINLQESQQRVGSLEVELESVKETKGTIEGQIEAEKMIIDELDTQLSIAKAKLSEVFHKVSCLEVELEDKRNCCEELEATCLELQLQLESYVGVDSAPKTKTCQEEKQSQIQSEWEITAASVKLAECQETIVYLGKQLKALATTKEAADLDTVLANKDKSLSKHLSLRDRMLAEDSAKAKARVRETMSAQGDGHVAVERGPVAAAAYRSSSFKLSNGGGALAIVPSKKRGAGLDLLKKLLLRRRKRNNGPKSRYSATKV